MGIMDSYYFRSMRSESNSWQSDRSIQKLEYHHVYVYTKKTISQQQAIQGRKH